MFLGFVPSDLFRNQMHCQKLSYLPPLTPCYLYFYHFIDFILITETLASEYVVVLVSPYHITAKVTARSSVFNNFSSNRFILIECAP